MSRALSRARCSWLRGVAPCNAIACFTSPWDEGKALGLGQWTSRDFKGLQGTSRDFKGLQGTSRDFKGLQKGLQGTSRDFKGLQGTSRDFKGLQGTSRDFNSWEESNICSYLLFILSMAQLDRYLLKPYPFGGEKRQNLFKFREYKSQRTKHKKILYFEWTPPWHFKMYTWT